MSLPGSEAWLSPPDEPTPPSGDFFVYVERPVPLVLTCSGDCLRGSDVGVFLPGNPVAYPHPLCAVHGDGDDFAIPGFGWVELEVAVDLDEGRIWRARLDGQLFELTDTERASAEEDWAMREPEERDEPELDADR